MFLRVKAVYWTTCFLQPLSYLSTRSPSELKGQVPRRISCVLSLSFFSQAFYYFSPDAAQFPTICIRHLLQLQCHRRAQLLLPARLLFSRMPSWPAGSTTSSGI